MIAVDHLKDVLHKTANQFRADNDLKQARYFEGKAGDARNAGDRLMADYYRQKRNAYVRRASRYDD